MTTRAYFLVAFVLVLDGLAFGVLALGLRVSQASRSSLASIVALAVVNWFCAGMCIAAAVLH